MTVKVAPNSAFWHQTGNYHRALQPVQGSASFLPEFDLDESGLTVCLWSGPGGSRQACSQFSEQGPKGGVELWARLANGFSAWYSWAELQGGVAT